MLKKIFEILFNIIIKPAKIWSTFSKDETDNNDLFLKSYLYPVIGIISLLTFVGVLFYKKEFEIQLSLRLTISVVITLFAGFYLASALLSEVVSRYFSTGKIYKKCERFVGYSSALFYVMYMVLAIFPDFSFIKIGLLYTIYIVWEGAISYMSIPEDKRIGFSIAATAIILVSPMIVETIMFFTMPGMRPQ